MTLIMICLLLLFIVIRSLKYLSIRNFIGTRQLDLKKNPKVSLIQPISKGATNLESNLISRFEQTKLSKIQHILICDELATDLIGLCKKLQSKYTRNEIVLLVAKKELSPVASKITKMNLGLKKANGKLIAFIDDDIELLNDGLYQLVQHLYTEQNTGVVFGLPIAVSNESIWSTVNSLFVNSQAYFSYIPLTYFISPYTITGHLFILKREVLESVGAFNGMNQNFDDDHDLGRRLINSGYVCIQSSVPYKVHNHIASFNLLSKQIKRWFMMPRQAMIQNTNLKERLVTLILSIDFFIPLFIAFFVLIAFSLVNFYSLLVFIFIFILIDQIHLKKNLHQHFKFANLTLYPLVIFVIPLLSIITLLTPNTHVYWRGQKLKLKNNGSFEVLE